MSEILPKTATRRFLDLQVHEVSLVDTPANEQAFIVAKRHDQDAQEDNDMTQAATQAATGGDDAARVSVDVSKAENEAVQAAMTQVTSLVDGIAKAAGVSLAPAAEPEPEPTTTDDDVEKGGGFGAMRKMYEAEMKGMGMSGDKLKKAMEKFDKKFPPQAMAKTQKNARGEGDTEPASDPAQTLDDTVSATLDTIQKAKAFTPARIQKLTEAMETLQKLMMEVISPGSSPKTKVPGVSQHSNPNTTRSALVGTQKSADGMADVIKGLDSVLERMEAIVAPQAPVAKNADGGDLASQLQSISKRLERIEAARPAPQSEGDGGGDVTTTTTEKSFWGSVI